eukprot:gene31884-39389_t
MEYDSDSEGVPHVRNDQAGSYWMSAEERAFYLEAVKMERHTSARPSQLPGSQVPEGSQDYMPSITTANGGTSLSGATSKVTQEVMERTVVTLAVTVEAVTTGSMDAETEISMGETMAVETETAEMADVAMEDAGINGYDSGETTEPLSEESCDICGQPKHKNWNRLCPNFHGQPEWMRKVIEATGHFDPRDKNAPQYKYDSSPDSDKMKRARDKLDYGEMEEPRRKSHYEPRFPRSPRSPPVSAKPSYQTPHSSPNQSWKEVYSSSAGIQRGGPAMSGSHQQAGSNGRQGGYHSNQDYSQNHGSHGQGWHSQGPIQNAAPRNGPAHDAPRCKSKWLLLQTDPLQLNREHLADRLLPTPSTILKAKCRDSTEIRLSEDLAQ